jgi:hypothetical protein
LEKEREARVRQRAAQAASVEASFADNDNSANSNGSDSASQTAAATQAIRTQMNGLLNGQAETAKLAAEKTLLEQARAQREADESNAAFAAKVQSVVALTAQ